MPSDYHHHYYYSFLHPCIRNYLIFTASPTIYPILSYYIIYSTHHIHIHHYTHIHTHWFWLVGSLFLVIQQNLGNSTTATSSSSDDLLRNSSNARKKNCTAFCDCVWLVGTDTTCCSKLANELVEP